jgi:phospholipase C
VIGPPADHSSRLARGELADPAETERLEAEAPEAVLRRREFLARTAAAAGLAGMAGAVPTETLIAEAAKRAARRTPLPAPRELPIDTFVVLMMENRSFDHYFGWHERADGRNAGLKYPNLDGSQKFKTHHLTPDFQGCGFRDPSHSWTGGRHQYNRGKLDGFYTGTADGTGSDIYALGYYLKQDLGFLPYAAEAYTLYDRYFCSIMASTYPNKHYQVAAQNGGQKSNDIPILDEPSVGFEWETILDRARANGVSAAYYISDLPFPALYGARGLGWTRPASQFHLDAALGQLPNICFVDPPYLGSDNGVSADDHPHADIRAGQAFMSDFAHSFIESPHYARGAMFINYDEWGGFFDHVKPRHVPDDRVNRQDLSEDWSLTGFRVPTVAISPYSRSARPGGRVSQLTCTHESILKLISYRFELGHLTKRHRYASNIGRSFRWSAPDFDPPELPDPEAVARQRCGPGGGGRVARPKPHDLVKLETSGLLDRLGYEVERPSFEQLFRYPDRVRRAFAEGG